MLSNIYQTLAEIPSDSGEINKMFKQNNSDTYSMNTEIWTRLNLDSSLVK